MARAKVGLTKKQMALELGVTRPTYDDYENYNTIMRIDVAQRFCDIVGVSIDDV
ncbi:helix-turn-helix transcriptional regulator, partial [Streptococcus suis]|nr:helix-turn-helix transcriptional regulator [Streptococcus suis]